MIGIVTGRIFLFLVIVGRGSSCGCDWGTIPEHIQNSIFFVAAGTIILGAIAIYLVLKDKI
jgi:hypothetical protein